jgi:trans-aconitate methyltransferase
MPTLTPVAKIEKWVNDNPKAFYEICGDGIQAILESDLLPFLQSLKEEERNNAADAYYQGFRDNYSDGETYFKYNYTQEVTT